jgi:hypothetical protein
MQTCDVYPRYVYLISLCLTGLHVTGLHFTGLQVTGLYGIGTHLLQASMIHFSQARTRIVSPADKPSTCAPRYTPSAYVNLGVPFTALCNFLDTLRLLDIQRHHLQQR